MGCLIDYGWVLNYFLHFSYKFFIRNVICKYFLQCFYSLNSVLNTVIIFNFDKLQYIFFSLMDCAFVVVSKNCSPNPRSWIFFVCFMFSSSGCVVLHFTFNTMIHFELIFNKTCSMCRISFFDLEMFWESSGKRQTRHKCW